MSSISPFLFSPKDCHNRVYQQWREKKCNAYPIKFSKEIIDIRDANLISKQERKCLRNSLDTYNFCAYRLSAKQSDRKNVILQLAQQLGLHRLDNNLCADEDKLTALCVSDHPNQHDYIPYTNRRLSWHTDGYYNSPAEQIYAFLLHCVQPAQTGGESLLLDHEMVYILLRDENPAYIEALMQPDVMTIPANILNGKEIRPARTGAVFSITKDGYLHMRYSARLRNIQWKQDQMTQEAVAFLQKLWQDENSPWILRYTLKAGEGIVCNNVLHRRTAFRDAKDGKQKRLKRLLYRGRYYDRIIVE